jgi:two-component system, cell cycle sensor histidine kinase and response regulator CckA
VLIRRLIGEDIELAVTASAGPATVCADLAQLEQVVMNLAVNSRDAMPDGGTLRIEVANVLLDASPASRRFGLSPGAYVQLTVSDTGVGMDEDTRARIFEPFFTTKGEGHGTGLGLSTVYGIVTQSGGGIAVDSQPGRGTSFRICLPQADRVDAAADADTYVQESARGVETVLLVEDEDTVRGLVRTMLEAHGYDVVEARSAEQAYLAAVEREGEIHLLLTDVVLPGTGGPELSERLLDLRPTMKVLFMSGYPNDVTLRHRMVNQDAAFLQKPFSPEALVRKVADVLGGR